MSLRLLGGALLLTLFAGGTVILNSQSREGAEPSEATRAQEQLSNAPRWEYQVIKVEAVTCSNESGLVALMNRAGRAGWELVNYERAAAFPKQLDGTMLIVPAATGPGKKNNPETTDSFKGDITLKSPVKDVSECRLLFKRQTRVTPE